MCVAKRGQQAKRMDVKTSKRRLSDEADPPGASAGAPLFSHRFLDPFFLDFNGF